MKSPQRSPTSRARAGSSAPNTVEVDGDRYTGTQRRAGHRLVRPQPARPRDRRPGHHLRPGARASTTCPSSVDRARRRRDRRRVRQRLEVLRRRRDHRRGAAHAGPERGRGAVARRSSARSASAASPSRLGVRFAGGDAGRHRRARSPSRTASTFDAELLLVAVGRGPDTDGLRLRGGRASRWSAASCSPTSGCAPTSRDVYAVGDIVPGLQLAHRGFQQGIFVAEEIAGLEPVVDRRRRHPAVTYCDPEVASRRAHRGAGREAVRRRRRSLRVQPRRQRQEPDPRHDRASSSWSRWPGRPRRRRPHGRRPDRRADRRGPADRRTGRPTRTTSPPLVHAHPTQNEALGEAHLALAGKPLHAHA